MVVRTLLQGEPRGAGCNEGVAAKKIQSESSPAGVVAAFDITTGVPRRKRYAPNNNGVEGELELVQCVSCSYVGAVLTADTTCHFSK